MQKRLLVLSVLFFSCNHNPPLPVPTEGKVFASSETTLYELEIPSGKSRLIGNFTAGPMLDIAALTVQQEDGQVEKRLYGVTPTGLYQIDPTTGEAAQLKLEGYVVVNSLTATLGGQLLGAAGQTLYSIDLDGRTMKSVGVLPTKKWVSGDLLQHNSNVYVTLGTDGAPDTLATVRKIEGNTVLTELDSTGFQEVYGLTELNGKLYGLTSHRELIWLDPSTGAGTKQADLPFGGSGLQ